jgi:Ca2+-binding RTX toxin-like protein
MAEVRRVVLIALFALLVAAPAAQAGTVAMSGSTLTVRGGGVANDLAVDRGGGLVRVHDGAGGLNAGNGCLRVTGFDVTCPDASVNAIVVFGEGGGDRIRLNTPGRVSAGGGSDSVTGSGGGDELTGGDGNDNLAGGPGPDRINGDAGNDTVDGGSEDDILRGGDGDDSVLGAGEADRVEGGRGNDTLDGGVGPDRFDGGSGRDTADYSSRSNPVLVDLDGNPDDGEADEGDNVPNDVEVVVGGSGDDRLTTIIGKSRTLIGNAGNDALNAGRGADSLDGGDGDDILSGGLSNDSLDGGPGTDTADFSYSFNAVDVNLTSGASRIVRGHTGPRRRIESDALRSIENVTGSSKDDRLIGDAGPNALLGGSGSDTLSGGGGPDLMAGGAGRDLASYASRPGGVAVALDGQANDGSPGEGDNVMPSTETVIGGRGRDTLIGNDRPNGLAGGAGDDLVIGLGGADRIVGGLGGDRIDAGAGSDRVAVRDATVDRVRCGDGRDAVSADKRDSLIGCESQRAVAVKLP